MLLCLAVPTASAVAVRGGSFEVRPTGRTRIVTTSPGASPVTATSNGAPLTGAGGSTVIVIAAVGLGLALGTGGGARAGGGGGGVTVTVGGGTPPAPRAGAPCVPPLAARQAHPH